MSSRLLLAIATVVAAGIAPVQAQPAPTDPLEIPTIRAFLGDDGFGKAHPEAPPEIEHFGRLAGAWEVEQEVLTQAGEWRTETPALWVWQYTLDGFAVTDLWYQAADALPQYMSHLGRAYMLSAIRVYDVKAGWRVAWMANGAGKGPGMDFGTFEAVAEEGRIVMRNSGDDPAVGLQRIVFSDVTDDSFRWTSEYSQDNGATWTAVMKVHATRIR